MSDTQQCILKSRRYKEGKEISVPWVSAIHRGYPHVKASVARDLLVSMTDKGLLEKAAEGKWQKFGTRSYLLRQSWRKHTDLELGIMADQAEAQLPP